MKDAPSDDILYEVKGHVGIVTFNRPAAHNALTFEMYDRLGEICATLPADRSVRAIVVTGAGGRAFGAGTDISLFRDFSSAAARASTTRRAWRPCSPSSSAARCRPLPPSPASAPAARP